MLKAAGILVHPAEGAFYLFPSFMAQAKVLHGRGITTGKELCERLLVETGVAMLPGEVFGRPPSELTARLAYVDFDGAKALSASETIPLDQPLPDDFTSLWCFNVIKAMEIIINWLKE